VRLIERDRDIILFLVGRIAVAVATFVLLYGNCFVSVGMASDTFDEIEPTYVSSNLHRITNQTKNTLQFKLRVLFIYR
jgi:hypothetical protein